MKPNWTPRRVRLGQIQAWDGNPRMSTKAQAQRIIQSERKFGQPVPFLLAPEQDGRFLLYDGHQRLAAWFTVYGADYEMDAMVSDRPLTEAEHKELVITLHTGATGSWNWESLSSWSAADLREWGMDESTLTGWNNDANNLKEMLNAGQGEIAGAESLSGIDAGNQFGVIVICESESHQEEVYNTLVESGYKVKVVVV